MTWNPQHPDESTPRDDPGAADREVRLGEVRDGTAADRLAEAAADDLTRGR